MSPAYTNAILSADTAGCRNIRASTCAAAGVASASPTTIVSVRNIRPFYGGRTGERARLLVGADGGELFRALVRIARQTLQLVDVADDLDEPAAAAHHRLGHDIAGF